MYKSPQTIAYRDIAYTAAAQPSYQTRLEVLTEAGNNLMDYQRPVTKFPRFEVAGGPTRGVPMLPGRLDFHVQAYVTRTKKSGKDGYSFDRISSELYPEPPPLKTWTFVNGSATRLDGRNDTLLYP